MKYIVVLIITLQCFCSYAQADTTLVGPVSYRDFVYDDQMIYALNSNGQLSVWDLHTQVKLFKGIDTTYSYTAIAKDKNNNIYLGAKGVIHRLNSNNFTTTVYQKLEYDIAVNNIFFNSQNKMFLIVPNAVYDPVKNKVWSKFRHKGNGLNVTKRILFINIKTSTYFMMPDYAFMDSADRIWMVSSFGEFGGTLQIFDAKNERTVPTDFNIEYDSFYPQSVFEDSEQNIYITSGLEHFVRSGNIIKITDAKSDAITIYDSEDFEKESGEMFDRGIFVGPGAFNTADQKLYFATSDGFFRAAIPDDGKIKEPEPLFSPELLATRENLAIGMQMPVKKIAFTPDDKLLFLTIFQGIGLYDGKNVVMLQ